MHHCRTCQNAHRERRRRTLRDGAEGRGGLRGEDELRRETGRQGRQRLVLADGGAATLAAAAKLTGRGKLPGGEGGADWAREAGRRGRGRARLEGPLPRCGAGTGRRASGGVRPLVFGVLGWSAGWHFDRKYVI